jgi:Mn2+/Fe2+ NRAMP family transporter
MSVSIKIERVAPARFGFIKLTGPGLIVAASGIGAGDIVAATVGGARFGVTLLWAIAVGAFLKFVLTEGIARWQLATEKTVVEGWAEYLPSWVKVYFGLYLIFWTVAVTAALTNATGLGIANVTGGAISQSWGGVLHSLFGFAFVWFGGYGGFEKVMKVLVAIMGFCVLVCAICHPQDSTRQRTTGTIHSWWHWRLHHDPFLQLLDA